MEERSTATLEKIQQAALAEFLDKGFLGASLRQIVKNAGVSTWAWSPVDVWTGWWTISAPTGSR